jgi:hypothetical protein
MARLNNQKWKKCLFFEENLAKPQNTLKFGGNGENMTGKPSDQHVLPTTRM